MRSFGKMIRSLVQSLNRLRVDYAITGAIAASYYGAPRTTVDFDVLAYGSSENIRRLVKALRHARIEVEEELFKRAVDRGAYNIVSCKDTLSPYTIDVILQHRKFEKVAGKTLGLKTRYQSPEELIRMKLRMIRATEPPERAVKDIDDVRAILKNIKVSNARIKAYSKRDKTLQILNSILDKSGNG